MAAEAIKKAARKAGVVARVEVQGAMGPEDRLKQSEIDSADVVLFANDVGIIDLSRFAGATAKTVKIPPHEVIKHPDKVIEVLLNHAKGGKA
jgi:fructose-specific phosphotransferase system component IIB